MAFRRRAVHRAGASGDRRVYGPTQLTEANEMKYAGMPWGMWALFNRSFEKQLSEVLGYDREKAKAISSDAKKKYKEIIGKLPEFEKGDRFKMNIVSCAMPKKRKRTLSK